MEIVLYNTADDPHIFPKHLGNGDSYEGTLRVETDFMNPSFTLEMRLNRVYNYAYIPAFGRYYYLQPPVTIRSRLVEYTGQVDVLQSWYHEFKNCPVNVSRSDSSYNAFINDGNRAFYQYGSKQYVDLGHIGEPSTIVLVTVG
ncbi:MAG: hypothetical protein J6Y60_05380 [Treponema sp.]|nr:hypothetical protein [Treponema sp.]